jgi:hypothetical protein
MQSKTQKSGKGQVGTRGVGALGSVCPLTPRLVSNYVNFFYQFDLFLSLFKQLNNAHLQEEVR